MTTTATWSTTTLPASKLAAGDRIVFGEVDVDLTEVAPTGSTITIAFNDVTFALDRQYLVNVHVPDLPVDGYGLFKPRPGWSPLGCTCLSRRGQDGNWATIATDPDCRWCNQHDDSED